MNIALIHDWLYPGGALEVFKDLIQQELKSHPDAEMKVFTMIADDSLLLPLSLQIP
ncbi:MAG: hypothetical protein LBO09_05460 [Candidatus Peribacteria bacterium]|jgi:hypothetical protein|nr:hypothetical protein [Candidatus Peribacteria bacterium]